MLGGGFPLYRDGLYTRIIDFTRNHRGRDTAKCFWRTQKGSRDVIYIEVFSDSWLMPATQHNEDEITSRGVRLRCILCLERMPIYYSWENDKGPTNSPNTNSEPTKQCSFIWQNLQFKLCWSTDVNKWWSRCLKKILVKLHLHNLNYFQTAITTWM